MELKNKLINNINLKYYNNNIKIISKKLGNKINFVRLWEKKMKVTEKLQNEIKLKTLKPKVKGEIK